MTSIAQWQKQAVRQLAGQGNPDAKPDADWMLCQTLNLGRGQLRLFGERALMPEQCSALDAIDVYKRQGLESMN